MPPEWVDLQGLHETYSLFRQHLLDSLESRSLKQQGLAARPDVEASRSASAITKEAAEDLVRNGIFISWGQLIWGLLLACCIAAMTKLVLSKEAQEKVLNNLRMEWQSSFARVWIWLTFFKPCRKLHLYSCFFGQTRCGRSCHWSLIQQFWFANFPPSSAPINWYLHSPSRPNFIQILLLVWSRSKLIATYATMMQMATALVVWINRVSLLYLPLSLNGRQIPLCISIL